MRRALNASKAPAAQTVFLVWISCLRLGMLRVPRGSVGLESFLQIVLETTGLEHFKIAPGQRLEGNAGSLGQIAHLLRGPVHLDLVPALDEGQDAGTRDLRKTHADLAAPVAG